MGGKYREISEKQVAFQFHFKQARKRFITPNFGVSYAFFIPLSKSGLRFSISQKAKSQWPSKDIESECAKSPLLGLPQNSQKSVTKKCLAHQPVVQSLCSDPVLNPHCQGLNLLHGDLILSPNRGGRSQNQRIFLGDFVNFSTNMDWYPMMKVV